MKKVIKDALGNRIKGFYEDRTRISLPRRTYTIMRLDGKAFHSFTKGLIRPFDVDLVNDLDATAMYLCANIQGAKLAFVQSDEISLLLTDFETIHTDAWFDGNIQKMSSVSASMATSKFNQLRFKRNIELMFKQSFKNISDGNVVVVDRANAFIDTIKLAEFDSRVFTIPFVGEVENYFIWRQIDTVRNSISSVAQSMFSHKELDGKNTSDMQEMCFQKGTNWNDFDPKYKRGRLIIKEEYMKNGATRSRWTSIGAPDFNKDREFLKKIIPNL